MIIRLSANEKVPSFELSNFELSRVKRAYYAPRSNIKDIVRNFLF